MHSVEEGVTLSDPWWKRRKKRDSWYSDIHDELEKLGDLIDETMEKVIKNSDNPSLRRSRVKGFFVRSDSDGKPKILGLDGQQPLQEEEEFCDEEVPLIDFVEDDEALVVLVALPGVKKDAINLRVTESWLQVSVDAADFDWCDELKFPVKVKPKSACASYRNGVLEVRLEKLEKIIRNKGISIKK